MACKRSGVQFPLAPQNPSAFAVGRDHGTSFVSVSASQNSGDFTLRGLRALVTGGGSGIGKAIADGMKSAGATVVVCDVNDSTKPDYVCDVANSNDVSSMFSRISTDLGGLDILVNNVGVPGPTARVDEMDPEAYDECVRVNLGGTFRCAHAAVPMLIESKGSMVNISTSAGIYGYPLRSPYVAAKWGIIGLTKSWAMELGEFGVRVNAICPGSVSGPRMDGVIARESAATGIPAEELRQGYANQVSLRTFVEASDIAASVVFLCSPAARFITGQVLPVDGNIETMRAD
ncbi:MAG: SDR family oxidoreductase [Actinobacteria bacterium]|nr:SDR family oxidoreductase [Actinomycetota bacterium]NDF41302.1 SDR family oxidoreductase [Actinomycetota bacterium]